jgi:hypothetical protein
MLRDPARIRKADGGAKGSPRLKIGSDKIGRNGPVDLQARIEEACPSSEHLAQIAA